MMNPTFYISAYATSPAANQWNADVEREYFKALAEQPAVIGIEHPFLMDSEKYSPQWLKANVPSHWTLTITLLPMLMQMAQKNAYFGLASVHEVDRKAAISHMKTLSHYVESLNQLFGRQVVNAIHLQSSPTSTDGHIRGCRSSLAQSLTDLQAMYWSDAALNIEHCDAYTPQQTPEKGYLSLDDEIAAASEVGGFGILLNWARSAIEGRSITTPLTHIQKAKEAHLLKGFFFSGCTATSSNPYGCWKDSHMPPQQYTTEKPLDNDSLLGSTEISSTLRLLDQQTYLGIKVANAAQKKSLRESIALNQQTIMAITAANKI